MDFATFYQSGGIFMHVITLLAIVSAIRVGGLARQLRSVRRGSDQPPTGAGADPVLGSAMLAMVAAGFLGSAMGWTEMHGALATVPPQHFQTALSRAGQIIMNPLTWSLICVMPLLALRGLVAKFGQRLSATA